MLGIAAVVLVVVVAAAVFGPKTVSKPESVAQSAPPGASPFPTALPRTGTPIPQPPGPAPDGKVWSPEHGHWHDADAAGAQVTTVTPTPAAFVPGPQPPGPVPEGKVWSPEHGHWHDAPATAPVAAPVTQVVGTSELTPTGLTPPPAIAATTPESIGVTAAGATPALTPEPPGTPPAGKVWSPEHGHYHDAPVASASPGLSAGQLVTASGASIDLTPEGLKAAGATQVSTPEPPGPAPVGKVWSPEHGHYHDAPSVQAATATPPTAAPSASPSVTPGQLVTASGTPIDLNPQAVKAAGDSLISTLQPPGPAPAGKVWSAEHGHYHDAPSVQAATTTSPATAPSAAPAVTSGQLDTASGAPIDLSPEALKAAADAPIPTFQPPGPAPAGKVWSPEHGHYHDAPPPSALPVVAPPQVTSPPPAPPQATAVPATAARATPAPAVPTAPVAAPVAAPEAKVPEAKAPEAKVPESAAPTPAPTTPK